MALDNGLLVEAVSVWMMLLL